MSLALWDALLNVVLLGGLTPVISVRGYLLIIRNLMLIFYFPEWFKIKEICWKKAFIFGASI